MPANNEDRKLIIKNLDKCIKVAYKGTTEIEYQALRVVRNYIKSFYDKEALNGSGRKDK